MEPWRSSRLYLEWGTDGAVYDEVDRGIEHHEHAGDEVQLVKVHGRNVVNSERGDSAQN